VVVPSRVGLPIGPDGVSGDESSPPTPDETVGAQPLEPDDVTITMTTNGTRTTTPRAAIPAARASFHHRRGVFESGDTTVSGGATKVIAAHLTQLDGGSPSDS